jgi:hypothetical protein
LVFAESGRVPVRCRGRGLDGEEGDIGAEREKHDGGGECGAAEHASEDDVSARPGRGRAEEERPLDATRDRLVHSIGRGVARKGMEEGGELAEPVELGAARRAGVEVFFDLAGEIRIELIVEISAELF